MVATEKQSQKHPYSGEKHLLFTFSQSLTSRKEQESLQGGAVASSEVHTNQGYY